MKTARVRQPILKKYIHAGFNYDKNLIPPTLCRAILEKTNMLFLLFWLTIGRMLHSFRSRSTEKGKVFHF